MTPKQFRLILAIHLRGLAMNSVFGEGYESHGPKEQHIDFRMSREMVNDEGFVWGWGGDQFYTPTGQACMKRNAHGLQYTRNEFKELSHDYRENNYLMHKQQNTYYEKVSR